VSKFEQDRQKGLDGNAIKSFLSAKTVKVPDFD